MAALRTRSRLISKCPPVSIDHGGGKQRGRFSRFWLMPRTAYDPRCDDLSFCADLEPLLDKMDRPQGQLGWRLDSPACTSALIEMGGGLEVSLQAFGPFIVRDEVRREP
jgi:hypothetical protein